MRGTAFWIAWLFISILSSPISSEEEHPKSIMKETPALKEELKQLPYRIMFETYQDNNWELYTIHADGSDMTNYTRTPQVHEMYPHVSRDGSKVCFVSDEPTGDGKMRCVYFMNLDGSGRTKVADHARQPCWSADGKSIAYLKSKYEQFQINDYATKSIVFYDLATGAIIEHPNQKIEHLYNLCWALNRNWFVATVHAGMGYSHTNLAVEMNGNRILDLEIGGCRPDLSPDGKHIAWGKTDNIIAVADIDFDTDVPHVSNVHDVVVDDLHVYHVDWSPDGKYLCYSRGPGGRVMENGPGTNQGIAELVGVRGLWDLCVTPMDGHGQFVTLTPGGGTYKEPDWFTPAQ